MDSSSNFSESWFLFLKMAMKLPTPHMNVKTQWDVTHYVKTLWAIQCKDLPAGVKLRLDILVVVVVIGAYVTEWRGHLFKGVILAITALRRDQSDRT